MPHPRSVLITGGTSGLGYHAAASIARQHPEYQVIIASRTNPHNAAVSINELLRQNNVRYLPLDLSSLAAVRSFAQTWKEAHLPPIQTLILNAGVQLPGEVTYTEDGFESTFAINHIGHALLFSLLRPHLSDRARIVLLSSGTHDPTQRNGVPDAVYNSAEELAHPTPESAKNAGRQRYATSKLTNVMWTYALHRRFLKLKGQKSWTVVAFDPGLIPGTGLLRHGAPLARFLWDFVLPHVLPLLRMLLGTPNVLTLETSSNNLAWIATDASAVHTSGVYYEMRQQTKSSLDSYDEEKQEDLWTWTVENIAANPEERLRFALEDIITD